MVIKKCKSTSGASIFIALFFLLLCGMAGSVILAAASTASKRTSSLKEGRQSYYSIVSAARLLQEEIEGQTYSRYLVYDESGNLLEDDYYQTPTSNVKDFLKGAIDKKFLTFNPSTDTNRYLGIWTVSTTEEELKNLITNVEANVVIDKDYNIKIVLAHNSMSCTLEIPAIVSTHTDGVVTASGKGTRNVTTITWSGGEIERN